VYIGRILDLWYRNPELLFQAIDELISENILSLSDISVEFFGTEKHKLDSIIMKLINPEFIKFFDRISYSDIPAMLNEAQMLLLLTNKGRNGILTTKFFEYAGVKKPILCIPGDNNELDSLILEYKLGYSVSDISELKDMLINWIELYKEGKFPDHIQSNVEYFTRENQTKILAEIFNETVNCQNE
jgi:glycosyltransferase involved in cell wall biosynthesis